MSLERIALVSCRSPFLDDSKIYVPMGNLVLKSYLNTYAPGIHVELVDDNYDLNDLHRFGGFDAVGLSIMTPQRAEADQLAGALKAQFPRLKVIAGGPHCTYYFQEMKDNPNYDHVVAGDGEKALLGLATGTVKDRVPFVGGLSKDEMEVQPRPDRTSENARWLINRYSYNLGGRKATTMMTARGCTEHCTFCEDARTNIRWTGMDSINAQLDDIVGLGFKGVYIFDDLFAIAMPKVKPIAEALHARDLIFRCNGQARYFTKWGEDFAKLLGDNGCYEIAFGHETGSQLILDNIKKRTTVGQNYRSVEYAKNAGIIVKSFILLGLPGETWETLAETEAFVRDSGVDDFQAAVFMPFKGTQIRDALDRGEDQGLTMTVPEVSGAYGIKGGETAYEVRTPALSAKDLQDFRTYLVEKYRPGSHREKWKDKFFEQARAPGAKA